MPKFIHRKIDVLYQQHKQLLAKIEALEQYGNGLCATEFATHRSLNENEFEQFTLEEKKKYLLLGFVKQLKGRIENNSYRIEQWQQFHQELLNFIETEIPPLFVETLVEHRMPLWRWFKEVVAFIVTGGVGSLAITAYNAYHTEKGMFSWQDIGFFSPTASLDKFNDVYLDIKQQAVAENEEEADSLSLN